VLILGALLSEVAPEGSPSVLNFGRLGPSSVLVGTTVTRTYFLGLVGEGPPPGSETYPVIEGASARLYESRLCEAVRLAAGESPVVVIGVIDLGGGMSRGVGDLESPPGRAILAIFGVEGTSLARWNIMTKVKS
jgi:hypothetical protein